MLSSALRQVHLQVNIAFLYPLTLFISASLLFMIQPMAAKSLLPTFGGTPSVWTICMLFFQGILLAGYGYAWFITQSNNYWRTKHLLLCGLSLLAIPISLHLIQSSANPEWTILTTLTIQLGMPMLIIAASAPLIQYAFSKTSSTRAHDPYFLYVASNIGSLLTLLAYPWLIERFLSLPQQFNLWNKLYVFYLVLLCYLFISGSFSKDVSDRKQIKASSRQKYLWVIYSFIPCSLLLSSTFYISTDLATNPLFWVVPFALYLSTFIITFAKKTIISYSFVRRNIQLFIIFPIIFYINGINQTPLITALIAILAGLFMSCLYFHGRLVKTRPKTAKLTSFYFCLSIGGVAAGIFNGLIAPNIFNHAYEYPLILLLIFLLTPIKRQKNSFITPLLVATILCANLILSKFNPQSWLLTINLLPIACIGIISLYPRNRLSMAFSLCLLFPYLTPQIMPNAQTLVEKRNFFGIKKITAQNDTHYFISNSTMHGFQIQKGKEQTNGAISYYGPVQDVINQYPSPRNVLTIGLGSGTIACQLQQNDKINFIEIDAQVIQIAKNPKLFSYLSKCQPEIKLIRADGLVATKKQANNQYNIIVMDAFSSDAIPMHLLTLEALQTFSKKITENGVILVHISNRHLDLLPVLNAVARHQEMILLQRKSATDSKKGQLAANWALLTFNEEIALNLINHDNWRFVTNDKQVLWTNNYSNIIPLLQ